MKLQPESKKELLRIAGGTAFCTAIMWVLFAALHLVGWVKFDDTVVLGGLVGAAVAVANFAGICFVVLALYLLYIAKMQGLISWYYSYAVPICAVICAMVALTTGLISKKIAKGIHIPALLSAEAAVFLIFLEALYDFSSAASICAGR